MIKHEYPSIFFSWTLISEHAVIKEIDKSVFISKETGIPKEISFFFELDDMYISEKRNIQLILNNIAYEAYFYKDPSRSERLKIRWKNDLQEQININFSKVMKDILQNKEVQIHNKPLIEFIKIDSVHYEIILKYRGDQS